MAKRKYIIKQDFSFYDSKGKKREYKRNDSIRLTKEIAENYKLKNLIF